MTRKLSVHAGAKPDGLTDFLSDANPRVLYLLNNTVDPVTDTLTIRRLQNDVWGRLPDAMGNPNYFLPVDQGGSDPIASARFELLYKTIYVPKVGHLNLIQYWKLGAADYYAPYNEPVLGDSIDHILKAQWLNAYTCEALRLAHVDGVKLCIFSFASSNPNPETWPYLAEAASLCAEYGGLIDLHAYGIEGALMSSPSSGALFYRQFHAAFPDSTIVISEASAGNGYNTGLSGSAWIDDMLNYAVELERDDYVLGACAFQSDRGAESHIPGNVLIEYGEAAGALEVHPPPPPEPTVIGSVSCPQSNQAAVETAIIGAGGRVEWY